MKIFRPKPLCYFLIDRKYVKDIASLIRNHKSNAIIYFCQQNKALYWTLECYIKAMCFEFILAFLYKEVESFSSLFHLVFGRILEKEHKTLRYFFDIMIRYFYHYQPQKRKREIKTR